MAGDPDISICIANFNGEGVLDACLSSVYSQRTNATYEVIVHDDASSDAAMEAAIEAHPAIRVILSETNVGYCEANNRMAASAKGRFLLLLNNDVELMDGALELLYHEANRDPSGVFSLAEYTIDGELSCLGMGLDIFFTPFPLTDPSQRLVYVMGACFMVSKSVWDEVGGFPARFKYTCEDLFFCLAARAIGSHVKIVDGSGYKHHISHSLGPGSEISLTRREYSERNRRFIISHALEFREKVRILPLFLSMHYLELSFHVLRARSLEPLKWNALKVDSGSPVPKVSVKGLLTVRATKFAYLFRSIG